MPGRYSRRGGASDLEGAVKDTLVAGCVSRRGIWTTESEADRRTALGSFGHGAYPLSWIKLAIRQRKEFALSACGGLGRHGMIRSKVCF